MMTMVVPLWHGPEQAISPNFKGENKAKVPHEYCHLDTLT
jgi:hypothetical protein